MFSPDLRNRAPPTWCRGALAVVIVLHLIAVVLTEIYEGGSIISAMFTGTKLLNRPPEDR